MLKQLQKKYVLSEKGSKDYVKAVISCTVTNLFLILPVSLLYFMVSDILNKISGVQVTYNYTAYVIGIVLALLMIFGAQYVQYNATFLSTYKESAVRRITLAERLRKLPLSFFGKKDLSDLTTTIMADCSTMETAFSHWMPEFAGAVISTVLVSINLFFFNVSLALAALWVLPVSLGIVFFTKKIQAITQNKLLEAKLVCADGIQECIEASRDIKANNAEKQYLSGLNKKIDGVKKNLIVNELNIASFVVTAQLILKLGIATVALTGAYLLKNNSITLLTFFAFLMVVSRLYDPMAAALQNLAAMIALRTNLKRMGEIENYKIQTGEENVSINGYDIDFKDVVFSYNNGEAVLNGVSFIAKQGEVTALIGPSGGGKSTIAKLAARFWDIDKGKITLGGKDISKIDPEKLLSYYSIVFQDVTLFDATVYDNIKLGRKDATKEEILCAAKEAQCDEFVENLSNGYDTMIGENGATLSGGERQRISIARAILKNSPIVILDEATASLDAENETLLQQALSKLVKGKTVLIIAHRMRTVANADKLIFLKDGIVKEQGKPQELIKKNGFYAHMSEIQTKTSEWKL